MSGWKGYCWAVAALACLQAVSITSLELSSHACSPDTTSEKFRTCTFSNLVLQDGQAYYLARGKVELPPVRVDFKMREDMESQYFSVQVVAPEELPPAEGAVVHLGDTHLWTGCFDSNYGHCLGENVVSLGNTLCEWMGRCTYQSRVGLTLLSISVDANQHDSAAAPAFLREALACISDQPMRHVLGPELRGKRVVMARALVGVGPTGRSRFRDGRKPMQGASMVAWRRRLGACFGYDADALAPTARPRIMVVARPYSAGRSLLNLEEVMAAIRGQYGESADVSVQYMEGLTVRQQAALWSSQSMVIHVHGSVLGSWQFLPLGAVALQLSALPIFHEHAGAFGNGLAVDFSGLSPNITWMHLGNHDWAYSHPLTEELWQEGSWAADLTPAQEQAFLRRGDCGVMPADKQSDCTFALHHSFNVVIRPDQLLWVVDWAWHQLFEKQGLATPESRGQPASLDLRAQQQQQQQPGAQQGPVTVERVLLLLLLVAWAAQRLKPRRKKLAAL